VPFFFVTGSCAAAEFGSLSIEKDLSMVICPDLEAKILRLYHGEKWRAGTIARQPRSQGS